MIRGDCCSTGTEDCFNTGTVKSCSSRTEDRWSSRGTGVGGATNRGPESSGLASDTDVEPGAGVSSVALGC